MAGAAALSAAPALGAIPASGEVEIAIVGAGAAGVAAARRVAAAGKTYTLVEASGRIGGRVRTGKGAFNATHDLGAYRLYGGARNPLLEPLHAESLRLFQPPPGRRLHVGGREARDSEYDDFTAALRRAGRAIAAAGEAGQDVPAARVTPELPEWQATVSFVLGPLFCSKDLEQVSTADFARAQERVEEIACRDGLGAVLAAAARPLTVELNTAATGIDLGERGAILLHTPRGDLRARAVILTVSTSVLASGGIAFKPGLPNRIAEALAALSLGAYDRIVFELPGNPFGLRADERILFKVDDARAAVLVGRINGSDLAYADVAGDFARDLARSGDAATRAFLSEFLAAQFGAEAADRIGNSEIARWSADPFVLGGFSAAAPGAAASRRVLMQPVADRLFLAGEAVHETMWGTVGGAWESGERAADAAINFVATAAAPAPPPVARPPAKRIRRRQ